MMAVVNYSKYIKYCEISILLQKSSKLKYWNIIYRSTSIMRFQFSCGDGAGTEKNAGMGIGTTPAGMEWGWGHGVRGWNGMGMGTVLQAWGGDGDEQSSLCSSLTGSMHQPPVVSL